MRARVAEADDTLTRAGGDFPVPGTQGRQHCVWRCTHSLTYGDFGMYTLRSYATPPSIGNIATIGATTRLRRNHVAVRLHVH